MALTFFNTIFLKRIKGPYCDQFNYPIDTLTSTYLFQSARLGFRRWSLEDLPEFAEMNADPEVMEHFPYPLSHEETTEFIDRLQKHHERHGYCYFATELLETGEFIGFIGMAYQGYESEFTPATDIGWRLKRSAWGKGYATEGAKRCLDYAFQVLALPELIATCTANNSKSEEVMKKIGMQRLGEFLHPKLTDYPDLERCISYGIQRENR